jgi:hypothetical protein
VNISPDSLEIPSGLPRAWLTCLYAAIVVADETGEVPGGQSTLARMLDIADRNHLRGTIAELEALGYMVRFGRPKGRRVAVVVTRLLPRDPATGLRRCRNCPRPIRAIPNSTTCGTCQAAIARHDRKWKPIAFQIWADGQSKRESEATIVYRIHAATNWPIWTRRDGGHAEWGAEGIVDWMMRDGMISDPVWRRRANAFASGLDGED